MAVRRVSGDDWVLWRDLRLEALATDPAAFGSTYEREAEFDEATWRQRLASFDGRPIGAFVDQVDDEDVGVAAIGFFDSRTVPMLVSMWVQPSTRGLGCGARLVAAAVAWAEQQGAQTVKLLVVSDNAKAISLYESCGFVAAAGSESLEGEIEMQLDLG